MRTRSVASFMLLWIGLLGWCSDGRTEGAEPSGRPVWTTSKLRGAPTPPEPFRVVSAFPQAKFERPISLQEIPDANRLLVSQINGKIFSLKRDPATSQPEPVGDLAAIAGAGVALFDVALHPHFPEQPWLFACFVHPGNQPGGAQPGGSQPGKAAGQEPAIEGPHTRVSKFRLQEGPNWRLDADSERVVITWPNGGHNGGCLRFGPDGLLYISTGDGSGPNPPDGLTTGQTVDDLLGAILRIDIDHPEANRPYGVPRDNPFVNQSGARPEVFAYGLRNPFKFGIDPQTGEVYVADNGWETWEMIHLVGSGTNCGWPVMEGRVKLRGEVPVGPTPIVPPIRDHHHSEANSVIGGPVYRGRHLPGLDGHFLYGDYITGTIWSTNREPSGAFGGRTLVDTDLRIVDFTQTRDGAVYVLDYDLHQQIFELRENAREDLSAQFPRRLSETGLFSSLNPLEPSPGVVPYEVVVPRWTDGAVAERWVAIPGTNQRAGRIELGPESSVGATYPDGTVFVKQLRAPPTAGSVAKPLETQILLYHDDVWNPYAYRWNEAGTEAELVPPGGVEHPVSWPDATSAEGRVERTWRTSAINECRLCHNAGPAFVLGFNPLQLDRSVTPAGTAAKPQDQLAHLQRLEIIARSPAPRSDVRLVDPADSSRDLNDRVRSYLHGNCGMCHHPGGNAIVSFYMTRDLTFAEMNTSKGTNIGTFGMRNAQIIVPGDPYRSVLLYRMSKLGYARMPYVGSQWVDSHGVTLVESWIRSLPRTEPDRDSPPLAADSRERKSLAVLSDPSPQVARDEAIRLLVGSTEGSLALATLLHGGSLRDADRVAATAAARNALSDVRGLFDSFLPESQRKKTLGPHFDPAVVLTLPGDAQRGRLIFFSDAARCRACHHADDAAQSVGPTLSEIHREYPRDPELLQQVIQPSLKIEEKYQAWIVQTTDGRTVIGLKDSETEQAIVLRTAEARRIELLKSEFEDVQKSPKSLMPDNVLADLTPQEAADLLAFIRSMPRK